MADQRAVFTERFTEIERELYRIAFLYLKNRDDALDCVQEAAFKCFRNYPKLKEPKYFKTWAVRITINCAKDILRSRGQFLPYRHKTLQFSKNLFRGLAPNAQIML